MNAEGLLLPYQTAWVRDRAPLKVHRKSRRVGLSWAEAYASVMHTAEDGGNIRYLSFRKDITRQFIDDCAYWVRVTNAAAGEVGEQVVRDEDRDVHIFDIRFANGRRIEALSNAPSGFRSGGKKGDWAIVDEAEFVQNVEDVLASALAYRIWSGEVHVISSVDIDGSEFDRLCKEVESGRRPGSLHTTTFRDAIDQGLFRRICKVNEQEWSDEAEAAWEAEVRALYGERAAQELDCITRSGDEFWLPWKSCARRRCAPRSPRCRPCLPGAGWSGLPPTRPAWASSRSKPTRTSGARPSRACCCRRRAGWRSRRR